MLPDVDVIGFAFGIRYGDMLGHRGLSHSFLFAAVAGVAAAVMYGGSKERDPPYVRLAAYFAAVIASHPLLDAATDGGLGVALFAPFTAERYFLPWQPIAVSPIGPSFFSARGLDVLISEAQWIWAPSLMVIMTVGVARKSR